LPDAFSIGGKTTLIEEMGDEKRERIYTFALLGYL
jgi:molybdopterin-guanine dinucleotide biosynthesis protein